MSETFIQMAAGLSDEARAAFARALLKKLEGTDETVYRADEEPAGSVESAGLVGAMARLSAAVEAVHAPEATREKGAVSGTEREADYWTLRARSDGGTSGSADETGRFPSAAPAAGTEGVDLEKLSERVRRDSRRYDDGFQRY